MRTQTAVVNTSLTPDMMIDDDSDYDGGDDEASEFYAEHFK